MFEVFKKKLASLARDEEGAALAVTVVVFMFMWMTCMGVYAVGAAVKDKVHLQNACDAAAYSAAVVQADTLSRIATINRAMSWTYVQMSRRQMDYIVDRWLGPALGHYSADRNRAWQWYAGGRLNCHFFRAARPQISDITLNGTHVESDSAIAGARSAYGLHWRSSPSFYAARDMERQILADKTSISEMNAAIKDLVYKNADDNLCRRIEDAAESTLRANLPERMRKKCNWFIEQSGNALAGGGRYLRLLDNKEEDENLFVSFAAVPGDPRTQRYARGAAAALGGGADDWFVRGDGGKSTDGASGGIQRSYRHWALGSLVATWTWFSVQDNCGGGRDHPCVALLPAPGCPHGHDAGRCSCETVGFGRFRATCRGDNNRIYDPAYYTGEKAEPRVLDKSYFGRNGTITVGLAKENENPFAAILGDVRRGIYAAFNHYAPAGSSSWTWCFSSAKTGWKYKDERESSRAFKVDWKDGGWNSREQSWNLCQSDLDAVFVPVRKAQIEAASAAWGAGASEVAGWVYGAWRSLGASSPPEPAIVAGGTFKPQTDGSEEYGPGRLPSGKPARTHRVEAEWGVGTHGGRFDWSRAADRMLH